MVKSSPLVCIIMATYNGSAYLKEQLDSIAAQTHKNWILFVSDDNSKDNTWEILQAFQKKHGKNKVLLAKNTSRHHGAMENFAFAFKNAPKADFYMFSDQDDVWLPEKTAKLLARIAEEPASTPTIIYCDTKIVDQNLNTKYESLIDKEMRKLPDQKYFLNHFLAENYFPGCVMMFNQALRETAKEIFLGCYMHDWWMALVAARKGQIICLKEPLHLYRQHENNTCGSRADKINLVDNLARARKIFKFHDSWLIWQDAQKVALAQAKELRRKFDDGSSEAKVVNDFIFALEQKSKLKRLRLLMKGHYYPIEKWGIIKLAWN